MKSFATRIFRAIENADRLAGVLHEAHKRAEQNKAKRANVRLVVSSRADQSNLASHGLKLVVAIKPERVETFPVADIIPIEKYLPPRANTRPAPQRTLKVALAKGNKVR